MLFVSLLLTNNQEYLLGSTSEGELYVWLFEEILMGHLNEKFEGENIFNNICQLKLKTGKISNLKLDQDDINRLFFNDDYFFYAYKWSDLLEEIKQRKLLTYPATVSAKFNDQQLSKLSLGQGSGENFQKINAVDYDLKGKKCFAGTDNGNIFIIDLESFTIANHIVPTKSFASLEVEPFAISAIKYYRDTFVVFGNSKGLLQLWNYENNKEIKTFRLEKESLSPIKCIETPKESRWLVVGHNDYITKWHLESGVLTSVMPVVSRVNALLVGSLSVFSAHDHKYIYQWNEAGDLQTKTETSNSSITTVIGDVEGKEKIMVSAGNGPMVDVFLNSTRVLSFLA